MAIRGRVLRALHDEGNRYIKVLLGALLLAATLAHAATYSYDADGRLRSVTSSTGASSEYIYDALGNLYAINAVPAGQLAIFAFTPNHGPVGLPVTITGQGFSTTPGNNVVKFNGSLASVTSATATQLIASVPAGATTGPISVSVGGAPTASIDNFVVTSDAGGLAPAITSFNPAIATSGASISVVGSHFLTSAGATLAGVNGSAGAVAPGSDSQLTFTAPSRTGVWPIEVITPYGSAQSSQSLAVLPAWIGSASNVVAATSLNIDAGGQPLNISTPNKYAIATFQAKAGQWVSLQFSQFTAVVSTTVSVQVFDDNGLPLLSDSTQISATSLSVHLPQFLQSGSYLVVLGTTNVSQFSILAESNPLLSSTSSTSLSTSAAGQSKRAIFNGVVQQFLGVNVSAITTIPSGGIISAVTSDASYPEGYTYQSASSATPFVVNAAVKTQSSQNSVVFSTNPNDTMTLQLSLIIYAAGNPTTSLTRNGAPTSINTVSPLARGSLVFDGTAGESLSLGISNLVTNPATSSIFFTVFKPDGTYWDPINGGSPCSTPRCHYPLTNLPQTGSYKAWFYPPAGGGTFSLSAAISTDVVGSLTSGVAQTVNLAQQGQVARLSFSGTAGQHVGLNMQNVTTAPTGGYVSVLVYAPNGSAVGGVTSTATGTFSNLPVLAQTGTYTVQIEPQQADTLSVQMTLVADPVGALSIDGSGVNLSTTTAGDDIYLTFNATAGQNLSLGISALTMSPAGNYLTYTVDKPDGTYLDANTVGSTCSPPGCHQALNNLPVSGTYSVWMHPSAGTASFTAYVSSDVTGSLTANTPLSLNLATPGQVAHLAFTGSIGQIGGVYLANVATTPSGGIGTISLYRPDGSAVGGAYASSPTNTTLNLPTMSTSGTYTVQVEPQYGDTATAQVTLLSPTALTMNAAAVTAPTTGAGQSSYFTFSATAGQNISVGLGSFVTTPSGGQSLYSIRQPNGSVINQDYCYAPGCHMALTNLPATGTYAVVVNAPANTSTMGFTAAVSTDITGTLTPNTSLPINLAVAGQTARFTYGGTAGQFAGLYLASVVTSPPGGTVKMTAFKPDGTQTGATWTTTNNGTSSLPMMTQTGTYTVQIEPPYGYTATAQLTLLTPTSVTLNGSSLTVPTTGAGQAVYLSFSATAAQNISVGLSNLTMTPAGGQSLYMVYQPNGPQVNYDYCLAPGCHMALTNLPATGNYVVVISPASNTATMSLAASVSTDVTGTLTVNTPASINLAAPGQTARFSYSGTAGQFAGLYLANVVTSPSGGTVGVKSLNPDGSPVSGQTLSTTTNGTYNPAMMTQTGTYTAQVEPSYGYTATAQLTLITPTAITVNGAALSVPTTAAGRSVYFSFNGIAAQNVTASLSSYATAPSGGQSLYSIYQPNGTRIYNAWCSTSTCSAVLTNLAATGTYVAVVAAPANTSTMSFNAAVTSP